MVDHFAPWHTLPITVIDYETTGVDDSRQPVQVAAVRFQGGEVVDSYSSLVNPGIPIPAGASATHGITDDDVFDAPSHADAVEPLIGRHMLIGAVLCAYSEAFDRVMLGRVMNLDGTGPWLDPLVMVRELDRYERGKGRHTLTATCKRWGVELDGAHNALADATATGKLLWAMRSKLGDVTYSELIRKQHLRAAEQNKRFDEWKAKQPPPTGDSDGGRR